jgi:hypothetical protein
MQLGQRLGALRWRRRREKGERQRERQRESEKEAVPLAAGHHTLPRLLRAHGLLVDSLEALALLIRILGGGEQLDARIELQLQQAAVFFGQQAEHLCAVRWMQPHPPSPAQKPMRERRART